MRRGLCAIRPTLHRGVTKVTLTEELLYSVPLARPTSVKRWQKKESEAQCQKVERLQR